MKSLYALRILFRPLPKLIQGSTGTYASDLFSAVSHWWREILSFLGPLVLLNILVRVPSIPASMDQEMSLGTIATIQGTVTGLSLIALVLAVELARRQEDRDDTVYEIMLRAAWIRPTFIFAFSALLTTLTAIAIVDFNIVTRGGESANLLLCAYVLTGAVGLALLATVTRTVGVLRPTGIIGFRYRANDHDRQRKVAAFIDNIVNDDRTVDDITASEAIEMLMQRHAPVGLTATERLFAEVDDALLSQQAARFAGAMQRITALIGNSADQIERSPLGYSPPGQPQFGYWFPLDALRDRLYDLWQAAYARHGREFGDELWSLEYWLISEGINRRSGELLELGLLSGRVGYEAAADVGFGRRHAEHEWVSLKTAAFWPLRQRPDLAIEQFTEPFAVRLVGFLLTYGDLLLRAGDSAAFRRMLSEFGEGLFDDEKRRASRSFYEPDHTGPLTLFEFAILALLSLAGRAIILKERGELAATAEYLEPITELVEHFDLLQRYVPAAHERDVLLREQWSLWELGDDDRDVKSKLYRAGEDFVMLPLLLRLLASESTTPLPSLRGYADRFVQAWNRHQRVLLEIAGIGLSDREEAVERFSSRLATAKAAEKKETEDIHLAAPLDKGRVSRFLASLLSLRQKDRIPEACFEQVGRVRRLDEDEWGEDLRFAQSWLLPRSSFVGDVIHSTHYAEFKADRLVQGFERGIAAKMIIDIEGSSAVDEATRADLTSLMESVDDAHRRIRTGRIMIAFVGNWPARVRSKLQRRAHDHYDDDLVPVDSPHYQVVGAYKGHKILWIQTDNEPAIAVVDLEHWGRLVRAPVNGEDFGAGLEEIDKAEAEERAKKELLDDADEVALEERVRQLCLLVRAYAEERTRFEIVNPDAARLIRLVPADGDESESEA